MQSCGLSAFHERGFGRSLSTEEDSLAFQAAQLAFLPQINRNPHFCRDGGQVRHFAIPSRKQSSSPHTDAQFLRTIYFSCPLQNRRGLSDHSACQAL